MPASSSVCPRCVRRGNPRPGRMLLAGLDHGGRWVELGCICCGHRQYADGRGVVQAPIRLTDRQLAAAKAGEKKAAGRRTRTALEMARSA
jgi:hypothetical protein